MNPPHRVVVTDANVLINLIVVDCLGVLGRLPGCEFVVPGEVMQEVARREQQQALDRDLTRGSLRRVDLVDIDDLLVFAELRGIMGSGEAACLALAVRHGWMIASDEKGRFRREVIARLGDGRLLTTAGIVLLAIRAGILTVERADEMKAVLERNRFRMKFGSFRDLLGPEIKGR